MKLFDVIGSLRSTARSREQVFGSDDSSVKLATDMADTVERAFELLAHADTVLGSAMISPRSSIRRKIEEELYGNTPKEL